MDDAAHLFSAYFYEGWDDYEYDTWESATDDFARRSPDRVAGAIRDITVLLDQVKDQDELGVRLRDLGCAFAPTDGDRAWLTQLVAHLGHALDGPERAI